MRFGNRKGKRGIVFVKNKFNMSERPDKSKGQKESSCEIRGRRDLWRDWEKQLIKR